MSNARSFSEAAFGLPAALTEAVFGSLTNALRERLTATQAVEITQHCGQCARQIAAVFDEADANAPPAKPRRRKKSTETTTAGTERSGS